MKEPARNLPPSAGPIWVAADPAPPTESKASKQARRRAALRQVKLATIPLAVGLAVTIYKYVASDGYTYSADWIAFGLGGFALIRGTVQWASI